MIKNKMFFAASQVIEDGFALYTFGDGSNFASGQGTNDDVEIPTQVGSDTDWKTVSITSFVGLAVKTDGTLWSWGRNTDFETGQGTNVGSTTVPTQVGSDTDWEQVAIGSFSSAAVKTDGTLWSWGRNQGFITAQGTDSGHTEVPTQVGSDTDWKSVVVHFENAIALKTDGTLWTWGNNNNFLTGQGTNSGFTQTPTQVGSDTDWDFIGQARTVPVAIKTDGTLWVWGTNGSFRTGLGTDIGSSEIPTQVGGDNDWSYAAGGNTEGFAVKTDGTLWSWGRNQGFITAQGTDSGHTEVPTQVGSDTDWKVASAEFNNGSALKTDGTIWTWGNNEDFATGQGTDVGFTEVPTQAGSESNFVFVISSNSMSAALSE